MDNRYNDKLSRFLISLQRDLKDKKIDEEQFKFLLGVFIKNEMNNFINDELSELLPEEKDAKKMMLLTYKRR